MMRESFLVRSSMSSIAAQGACAQVSQWIEEVVIGLNFCPFAQREWREARVKVCATTRTGLESVLEQFADEALRLLDSDTAATTLLVLPEGFESFDGYLDLIDLCEALVHDCGWDEVLQVASFHPDYCFEGLEEGDPANYTNRSPIPVVHLLRQRDVSRALEHHEDPASIPVRNEAVARAKGNDYFQACLIRCQQSSQQR